MDYVMLPVALVCIASPLLFIGFMIWLGNKYG